MLAFNLWVAPIAVGVVVAFIALLCVMYGTAWILSKHEWIWAVPTAFMLGSAALWTAASMVGDDSSAHTFLIMVGSMFAVLLYFAMSSAFYMLTGGD